ncbi:MAG: glycosyltransferase family 1 protein [Bacteroidia bacterium]|nr:glycosyltransferase family 1 protein [Bacteroidia bacterium]
MSDSHSTLIIGGAFRVVNGKYYVQKRSWEMLRIFSDQMLEPVFGMLRDQNDDTLAYPLPGTVQIVELPNAFGKVKLINTVFGRGLTPDIKRVIDTCCVVYLRQPLWECWDVFKYARSKGKKTIVSYHGDWPDALRKTEAGVLRHIFNICLAGFIHHTFKNMAWKSEIAFCVGEVLQAKYGVFAKNSVVFANFLHASDDIIASRSLRTAPPYRILFVGGFEKYKGVGHLIRAAAILKQQGLEFSLVLVGAGSLEKELRALAKSEGVAENIEWMGYIQYGPELMNVYRQADIFVLPSIASEGMAKVLMEAMTQGVPVIATDVGSSRRLLGNGEYGVIVQPADELMLAEVISSVLADPDIRTTYINNGFQLARISTKEKQAEIVRAGLEASVPELIGTPPYLRSVD